MRTAVMVLCALSGAVLAAQQQAQPDPRQQPGAMVHIFAPEQHDLYDGHFVMSANRIYMVGGLKDPEAGTTSTTRRRTSSRSAGLPRSM